MDYFRRYAKVRLPLEALRIVEKGVATRPAHKPYLEV